MLASYGEPRLLLVSHNKRRRRVKPEENLKDHATLDIEGQSTRSETDVRKTMKRWLSLSGIMICLMVSAAQASERPPMELWRLDCGKFQINNLNLFSDVDSFGAGQKHLIGSCYLIRHGDTYMLWDTGLPVDVLN